MDGVKEGGGKRGWGGRGLSRRVLGRRLLLVYRTTACCDGMGVVEWKGIYCVREDVVGDNGREGRG